ncbi:TPA: ABC transporter permease [Candidatus Poribacteria bacterium]|nr:ABC transporter permease [Flavobacteriales bacterium]HIO77591.1 ABC transporter permease [Candidatus Poribacteria bacterium]
MIALVRAIIRSLVLLILASFIMFKISMFASIVSISPSIWLTLETPHTSTDLLSPQQIIELSKSSNLPDDAQFFKLAFSILYLQVNQPHMWNQLKPKILSKELRRKIRDNPELRTKIDLPTPLTYLNKISNPREFINFDFVQATAYYKKGEMERSIDIYTRIVDSENILVLSNLSSLLISKKKESEITKRLHRVLDSMSDETPESNLLHLRLGEAYIAKRKFQKGKKYLQLASQSNNQKIAKQAKLWLSEIKKKGLDISYLGWLYRASKLDFGKSVHSGKEIGEQIITRFLLTFKLTLFTTIIAFGVAVPLGVFLGKFPSLKLSNIIKSMIYLLSGIPVFLTCYLCLKGFPQIIDSKSPKLAYYFIIGLCLAFGNGLMYQMIQRIQQETRELLQSDFFLAIRARKANLTWHLMVNLSWPVVSTFVSQVPLLLSGAIVVEVIFTYQGIGHWLFVAVQYKDFPVILPACALLVIFVCLANLVRDFFQYLIDPRLRY